MDFQHFDSLYQNGKRIILSSDRPPSNIDLMEERIRSCFECGLLADIQMSQIQAYCTFNNCSASMGIVDLILNKYSKK